MRPMAITAAVRRWQRHRRPFHHPPHYYMTCRPKCPRSPLSAVHAAAVLLTPVSSDDHFDTSTGSARSSAICNSLHQRRSTTTSTIIQAFLYITTPILLHPVRLFARIILFILAHHRGVFILRIFNIITIKLSTAVSRLGCPPTARPDHFGMHNTSYTVIH